MKILPIPVLSDNYAYVLIDEATNEAGVVDPSEAGPVAAAIKREGVNFTTIINTHHHWDHVGGNKELVQEFPQLKVYGHKRDETRTPCITHMVDEGDTVRIGNLEARFSLSRVIPAAISPPILKRKNRFLPAIRSLWPAVGACLRERLRTCTTIWSS